MEIQMQSKGVCNETRQKLKPYHQQLFPRSLEIQRERGKIEGD